MGVTDDWSTVKKLRCSQTGMLFSERWETGEGPHNLDGPACRSWDRETGHLTDVEYWEYGQPHRDDDQPQSQHFDAKGNVLVHQFLVRGEFYRRDNLPHREFFDPETYHAYRQEYLIDRGDKVVLHHDTLPALRILNRDTGELIRAEYYRMGRKVEGPKAPAPSDPEAFGPEP